MKEQMQETIEKNMFRLNDDMIIENLTRATEMLKNSMQHAAEKNNPMVAIGWVPGAIFAMEEAVERAKKKRKRIKFKTFMFVPLSFQKIFSREISTVLFYFI